MGIEIKISGSTPLECLSMLASAGSYCMYVPVIADAAKNILDSANSAMTPGPHSHGTNPAPQNAASAGQPPQNPVSSGRTQNPASAGQTQNPAPVPASGSAPATLPPSGPDRNQPPVSMPPVASAAHNGNVPAGSPNGAAPGSPGWYPPNAAPGGMPVNPTTPGTGPNATMNQTSLFNQNPGNLPPVSNQNPGNLPPVSNQIPGNASAGNPAPAGQPPVGQPPVSTAPGFTLEQVSKAGADLVTVNPAKQPELQTLLRQYGVQALSELRPEQLGPFALALRGMGANI